MTRLYRHADYLSICRKTFLLPLRTPFLLCVLPCLSASSTLAFSSTPRSSPAPNDSTPFLRGTLTFGLPSPSSSTFPADPEGTQLISIGASSVLGCLLPPDFLAEATGARRSPNVAPLSPALCDAPPACARRGTMLTFFDVHDLRVSAFSRAYASSARKLRWPGFDRGSNLVSSKKNSKHEPRVH